MEIYMHREIGKRGSLDMIRDIVMINEEDEEKEEKNVKKRKRKPDDSGKKKRPPQRTPLKYFLTGSGCTIMAFSIGILVCRELPYIMRWLSGYMEDLGFIGVMLIMAIFGFAIIMLADEISYLMTEELDDGEEFLFGIDDPDDPEYYTFYDSFEDPECDFGDNSFYDGVYDKSECYCRCKYRCGSGCWRENISKPELKVVRPENDKNENKKNEDVSNEDEDK